jgi:hypothetical protein
MHTCLLRATDVIMKGVEKSRPYEEKLETVYSEDGTASAPGYTIVGDPVLHLSIGRRPVKA